MNTEVISLGVKLTTLPQLAQQFKFEWSNTSTPPIRLYGVDKDNFTFSGGRSLNY